MKIQWDTPRFAVLRDRELCVNCRICEQQCAFGVHKKDEKTGRMQANAALCVDCQRCVACCPTGALQIRPSENVFRPHVGWSQDARQEIYRQAATGGVLLSSMGSSQKEVPCYWDKLLLNASQVTNPPIDPLREPMETEVYLGRRPDKVHRGPDGKLDTTLPPHLELKTPILFAAMSYGAISYNVHAALSRAAQALGTYYNTGEGGLHRDLYPYGANTIVQVASGRFGVHREYLMTGSAIEIKIGQGAKPGIGGHLTGAKIVGDVARTRMVPEGMDAISPAPHHDIYSIEDLRQLVASLKEATGYTKPVIVKVAAVHNIAAIASGIARSGADAIAIDGFRGGTGAAPARIRDNGGHSHRTGSGCGGRAAASGADSSSYLRHCFRFHPQLGRCGQGHRPWCGRGVHRHSGAVCAGLPHVRLLPYRPVQLGHCHPAPGSGCPSGSGRGRTAPGEFGKRLDP